MTILVSYYARCIQHSDVGVGGTLADLSSLSWSEVL